VITDPLAVFLTLAVVVSVAVGLERRLTLVRRLSPALVGILVAMALSNVGILPESSAAYDLLMGRGVSVGIALILLSVDVRTVLVAGPRMLAAFGIGALGTAVGAIVGGLLLSEVVGPETWKLSGQFVGTYTGGGVNFAALGRAFETSSTLFTAATAADVIITALWMATCLAVPVILGYRATEVTRDSASSAEADRPLSLEHGLHTSGRAIGLGDAAALIVLSVGSVWLSEQLGHALPAIPDVLWLTTIVLLLAQARVVRSLPGSALWGNYLVLLFLASNGARSVVARIFEVGPAVFYFALVTVAVHGVIIFGLGRLARLDVGTLTVASQANIGGTASAMAIAGARGYSDRIVPGVAVGLLGYAIGNYLGFGVAALVRAWLGA